MKSLESGQLTTPRSAARLSAIPASLHLSPSELHLLKFLLDRDYYGTRGGDAHVRPSAKRSLQHPMSSAAPLRVRLTSRENEVLRWVAQGKRNREIGLILNASSRTIQKHVQSILHKLGVETRGSAAAWWFGASGLR